MKKLNKKLVLHGANQKLYIFQTSFNEKWIENHIFLAFLFLSVYLSVCLFLPFTFSIIFCTLYYFILSFFLISLYLSVCSVLSVCSSFTPFFLFSCLSFNHNQCAPTHIFFLHFCNSLLTISRGV